MFHSGLPSYDPESQSLVHRKFRTPVSAILKCDRASAFGFLWGVSVTEQSGAVRTCLVGSRGETRDQQEVDLEYAMVGVAEAAFLYWSGRFRRALVEDGQLVYRGVRLAISGEVEGYGVVSNLKRGRFSHEIVGETLRLRFAEGGDVRFLDWQPGLAREPLIAILHELRQNRKDGGHDVTDLRRKAKDRIGQTIRDLACLFMPKGSAAGREKLVALLRRYGVSPILNEAFLAVAPKLLIQKTFVQKAFEDIMRYHERTMQNERSYRIFTDFIRLAGSDGDLNARQIFALYEIGLFLGHSVPSITDLIGTVLSIGRPTERHDDPGYNFKDEWRSDGVGEKDDARAKADARGPAGGARPGAAGQSRQGEASGSPPPPRRPYVHPVLMTMLRVLSLAEMPDEKALGVAWKAQLRKCHPDTLPMTATKDERDEANAMTVEVNLAYEMLLKEIRPVAE